jgi:hypothetical protein
MRLCKFYHNKRRESMTREESVEKVPWPLRFLQENRPIKQVTKDFFNTLRERELSPRYSDCVIRLGRKKYNPYGVPPIKVW